MTLSDIFSVLSTSVPVFKRIHALSKEINLTSKCVRLLERPQSLFGYDYWWSDEEFNGVTCTDFVDGPMRNQYISDLTTMAKK